MRLIDADKLRLSYWVSPTSTVSTAGQYYFYSQEEVDNAPTIEAVSVGTLEQFKWERDIAIEQLNEIGKDLGSKMDDVITVVRCKDCMYADSYYHCTWANFWGTADDYCSRAKPKIILDEVNDEDN